VDAVVAGSSALAVALILAVGLALLGLFVVVWRELRLQPVKVLPPGYRSPGNAAPPGPGVLE